MRIAESSRPAFSAPGEGASACSPGCEPRGGCGPRIGKPPGGGDRSEVRSCGEEPVAPLGLRVMGECPWTRGSRPGLHAGAPSGGTAPQGLSLKKSARSGFLEPRYSWRSGYRLVCQRATTSTSCGLLFTR